MKKYFTKYLPVEGEIKEGDFFQYLGRKDTHQYKGIYKAVSILGSVGIADQRGIVTEPKSEKSLCADYVDCYKVKLFLCSRDIQVGERVETIHGTKGVVTIINERGVFVNLDEFDYSSYVDKYHHYKKESVCKVIGEISPDATWVTEGMEFDGDELNIIEHIVAERCGNNATNEFYCNYMLPKEWINDHSDWWTDGTVIPGKTIVEIKGPCGHFH